MITLKRVRISEKMQKWLLAFYIFVLVFDPPFIPHTNFFLALATGIVLLTRDMRVPFQIAVQSGLFRWLTSMALLAFYVLTVPFPVSIIVDDIVNFAHYRSLFNRFVVLIVCIAPCSVFLIQAIKKYPYEYFIEVMACAGLIEGVCSTLAYLFPPVKQLFISLMGRYSSAYDNDWYTIVRAYGFAGTLVDLFGLAIALISGVCFYYGMNHPEKRKYVLSSFVIAVSTLLNARTGVLIFIAGIVVTAYNTIRSRHVGNIAFLILLLVAAPSIAAFILSHIVIRKDTADWIENGLMTVFDFLRTGDMNVLQRTRGTSTLISARFWQLPRFPRILIGTGHTLYGARGYLHSDGGYVNDLWLGGIVAYILLYKDIFLMGYRLWKQRANQTMRFVGCYCVLAFLIFNIKGAAIGGNPGADALFLLLFVSTYYARKPEYGEYIRL